MEWNKFTMEYFKQRGTLANVLLLIDASIPPLPLDLYCANWLAESQVCVVFTWVLVHEVKVDSVYNCVHQSG